MLLSTLFPTSLSTSVARIRTELFTWNSLAFAMALLEGGVIGVIIKNGFDGKVSDVMLNIAVALATGAPFYANLVSFIWVKLSHGKDKAKIVSNLSVLCCLSVIGISFIPLTLTGLWLLLILFIFARVCWSGVLTVRSSIWRVNYPRHIRGKVTAKLTTITSLIMSVASIAAGWFLDWQFSSYYWLFIAFGLLSLTGAIYYRTLTVRHQHKSIQRERSTPSGISISNLFSLLFENRLFGKYMLAMFVMGSGNLMFMAPLIVYLNEHTSLAKSSQVLITTALPLLFIPLAVNWWARLLDRNHIFHFRSIHCWGFVGAIFIFVLAQLTQVSALYFIAASCYGMAIAGGIIGWNLGHNDFVGKQSPMEYMAVHVTLTGIRGLLAPLVGIGFYQWLESVEKGFGQYALILPLMITATGGILFVLFNRQRVKALSVES